MTTPAALMFPPSTFAKFSPAAYLQAHLTSIPPNRPSNRRPNEFRQPSINPSSLSHCNGSAVVRCGDTAVVCGIRAEILYARDIPRPYNRDLTSPTSEIETLGLLVPNLELSTGCAPGYLPGSAPLLVAQSLSQRLLALLHSTRHVNPSALRIRGLDRPDEQNEPDQSTVKAYWTLYIDALVMSLDGNAFDVTWAAIVTALRDTLLPLATWDPDTETITCSPHAQDAISLKSSSFTIPIAVSFAVFPSARQVTPTSEDSESWMLADPDAFEEELCDERITVIVDGTGLVLGIQKSGGPVVGHRQIRDLVDDANRRWKDWERELVKTGR